jgi:hypothetical protein
MMLISRKYIDDNDIVARYLADQLSDAERESFEAYYLEHPEMVQELNRTAQFKSGLMDLRDSGALNESSHPLFWWQRTSRVAIAASLILVVIFGFAWVALDSEPRPALAASITALTNTFQSTLPVANSHNIQRTRTSFNDATIRLPANPAAIELRVKPEAPAVPARYRISLGLVARDDSITHLIEVSGLQSAEDGFVTVFMNAPVLTPGVYELQISGDVETNATSAVSSFLIELVSNSDK